MHPAQVKKVAETSALSCNCISYSSNAPAPRTNLKQELGASEKPPSAGDHTVATTPVVDQRTGSSRGKRIITGTIPLQIKPAHFFS